MEKVKTKADRKITSIVIPQSALAFTLELIQKDCPKAKVSIQVPPKK